MLLIINLQTAIITFGILELGQIFVVVMVKRLALGWEHGIMGNMVLIFGLLTLHIQPQFGFVDKFKSLISSINI